MQVTVAARVNVIANDTVRLFVGQPRKWYGDTITWQKFYLTNEFGLTIQQRSSTIW